MGNGGPGHIPLDIAAEVARSVNAGTTGLMPKELAKRQLETARQILSERRASALQASATEHGNTPETERAVLDTPVEKEDGTLTTLREMVEGSAQSQEEPAERGLNIGDEKGIYTTKVDTQNPKTPDGKNTVIFRRRPEESMRRTEEAQVIEANEEALPQGVELGDKDTPYTPEERQRVRAFTKERAREQRGEVQNADFGRIVIGRDFVNEVTRHALSTYSPQLGA